MKLGIVGLGRMGSNIARRLHRNGHDCIVFDRNAETVGALAKEGMTGARDLADLVQRLQTPRIVWLMLPHGEITEEVVTQLGGMLASGDVVIDGGNSFYKDDIRRSRALKEKGIHYLDVGTSGGVWGLDRGYCLMIGGDKATVDRLDPIFGALAPGKGDIAGTPDRDGRDPRVERGYGYCGPSGAGRFVKMIHNGIEYGVMQAYAEGMEILSRAPDYAFDLADIAELWRRGSVIGSWLLDLTAAALAADPKLATYSGKVEDSGEGRWTVMAAIEEAVPADVLSAALYARFRSRETASVADRLLSAMRHEFGGHVEPK